MLQKLEKVTEAPKPSKASIAAAKKTGAKIVPYSPKRLRAFLAGRITLADLEGITKESQYDLAQMGYKFLLEGRVDRAEKVFAGLLALDPFDAYFHLAMGSIAQRKNDHQNADRFYTRALEINPWSVHAHANRGEVRLAQGRIIEAIDDLVAAIDQDPQGKDVASQRARVLLDAVMKRAQAKPAAGGKNAVAMKSTVPAKAAPVKSAAPLKVVPKARPAPAAAPKVKRS